MSSSDLIQVVIKIKVTCFFFRSLIFEQDIFTECLITEEFLDFVSESASVPSGILLQWVSGRKK